MNYKLTQKDKDELPYFINVLRKLDENQIERLSEWAADGMIKKKKCFPKQSLFLDM